MLKAELERILRIAVEPSQSMPMEQVYITMQEELSKLIASLPEEGVMINRQAERKAQAKEWLFENIGPCDIDSELNKSLADLLAATERAVWEEAAQIAETPMSGEQDDITREACDGIAHRLRQRAKEGRDE